MCVLSGPVEALLKHIPARRVGERYSCGYGTFSPIPFHCLTVGAFHERRFQSANEAKPPAAPPKGDGMHLNEWQCQWKRSCFERALESIHLQRLCQRQMRHSVLCGKRFTFECKL
uniref:Uncharacterized protein n=1 Tax=Anopheles atroparvus TaxID=41427 RepID=A0AAG5DD57_ANOAO